jgi:hypothetical protein
MGISFGHNDTVVNPDSSHKSSWSLNGFAPRIVCSCVMPRRKSPWGTKLAHIDIWAALCALHQTIGSATRVA